MADGKTETTQPVEKADKGKRPLGLSLLLIFSFVYNGLLTLVMATGLFFPGVVQNLLQRYYKHIYISPALAVLWTLAGVVVFGFSFFGLVLLWRYKRRGFLYYASAQIIILALLIFVFHSYDLTNISIAVVVLVIFGLYAKNMK